MKTDPKPHVLIVDDEPNVRRVLGTLLEQAGYVTRRAESGQRALELVRSQDPDLVLTDLKMPGMDGMELLRALRESFPEIPVILLTAHGTVETAVEAMKQGAYDFLTKPFDKAQVVELVGKALGQAERGREELRGPLAGARCGFIGRSPQVEHLREVIEKVAPSPATVLVLGETGTGKELAAEALHDLSPRAAKPLIRVNCGALPESLVESELFGYERGAFTGADRAKPGRFELADGGTLFLDEIGELPAAAQVKLLRVLQDGLVDRVGGTAPRSVDVRLIAATHRDLAQEVAAGRFREDLFYRLKVIELQVPPLRAALMAQPWPGNVRELDHAVERAVLLADGPVLTPFDFGLGEREPPGEQPATLKAAARAAAAETERRMIRAALEVTEGNVTHAAERLGLSRRGLQLKMKDLGLR